jgi:hypothetical protein
LTGTVQDDGEGRRLSLRHGYWRKYSHAEEETWERLGRRRRMGGEEERRRMLILWFYPILS